MAFLLAATPEEVKPPAATTDTDRDRQAADLEDALSDGFGGVHVGARADGDEFVAADPAHDVSGAHPALQSRRQFHEHHVAGGMAERSTSSKGSLTSMPGSGSVIAWRTSFA